MTTQADSKTLLEVYCGSTICNFFKNSSIFSRSPDSDLIGNQTRNLPAYTAPYIIATRQTVLPRDLSSLSLWKKYKVHIFIMQ
jgi:hypothetical protein